jgi:hypothetical protein
MAIASAHRKLRTDPTQAITWVGNYRPFGAVSSSSQSARLGQDLRPGQENDMEDRTGPSHKRIPGVRAGLGAVLTIRSDGACWWC